jgi:ribose transport system ATP-binding protein
MTDRSSVPALEVRGLTKTFGEQRALDRVTLTILPGTVHGLLGENGSGKSTMIKILSGFYEPDEGELLVHGVAVPLPLTPTRSAAIGLQFVHQDLGLIPSLTVAENLMLGALSSGETGALLSDRSMQRSSAEILARYDVHLNPADTVVSLQPVERALLAIVRAIHASESASAGGGNRGVLVLDEPTVFLPRRDVERVFTLVRRLAEAGSSVIIVSHDLDEVLEVTDHVTVLRDGTVAGTGITAELSRDELIRLIVGRAVDLITRPVDPADSSAARPPALVVTELSGALVDSASFTLGRGEILGLTGLAGSGYDQVPYLIYGARDAARGEILVTDPRGRERSSPAAGLTPQIAQNLGLGLLPSDRRNTAGIGTLDLVDNISMLRLDRMRRWFGLDRKRMRADTTRLLGQFDVRPRKPLHGFGTLSGGNQQKALLAKWLSAGPTIFMIDEPTQGVDIGARSQIFDILREAAAGGISVICASTDHEQLAVLTDRTLIFGHGRVLRELRGPELSKTAITEACMAVSGTSA